jgi:hypothetical protein
VLRVFAVDDQGGGRYGSGKYKNDESRKYSESEDCCFIGHCGGGGEHEGGDCDVVDHTWVDAGG